MIRLQVILTLLFGCLVLGCSNPQTVDKTITIIKDGRKTSYEIHLKEVKDSKETKLTDLAKDFEFVALETNEECLFERGKFLITEEYILVRRRSHGILQFDRQGKFLRTLVKQGAGPREYRSAGWVVDETSQILYLADRYKINYLMRFDLKSGDYLGDLKKAIPISSAEILLTEKNNLVIIPTGAFELGTKPFFAFEQNDQGELISQVEAPDDWINRYIEKTGIKFDNNIWFQNRPMENLSLISKNQITPFLTFDFGQKLPEPGQVGDMSFRFNFAIDQQIYFSIFTVTGTQTRGESFISYGESKNYIFDPKEGKTYFHELLYLNPTHHKIDANDREFNVQDNGIIYFVYSAIDLITQAEKALQDDDFNEPYRRQLKEITDKLSEESNPVLLLGNAL